MKSHREQRPSQSQPESKPKQPRVRTFHDIPPADEFHAVEAERLRREAERQAEDAELEQVLAQIDAAESLDIAREPHAAGGTENNPLRHRAGTKVAPLRRFRENLASFFGTSNNADVEHDDTGNDQAAE